LVQGVYIFELLVTDNNGANGYDTIIVAVNAAAVNIPPISNAGNDQTITLPLDSVALSGNGMDADGFIKAYSWKQISGPSNGKIVLASGANTLVNNLVAGTYDFELTVTDNLDAFAKDTVTIVVAAPRISFQNSNRLKVYPNPVQDNATLEITTAKSNANLLITITDVQGTTVYTQQLPGGQSSLFYKITMSNLIDGIYVITVYFNSIENQSIRVLKAN
ncbi:MAG: T9SS type A sorting domain-containing protein, partial [Bacteroidota bacterium]|nr:T9SS type A sorting domain-containing protein [Bacteroidota bacterium]